MMQFIIALEKTAASCHYTMINRFDSFAPIRLNVAAQWLVDGVHLSWHHDQNLAPLNSVFPVARLLLESLPRHSACQGEHIHP